MDERPPSSGGGRPPALRPCLCALLVGLAAVALGFARQGEVLVDDAYITFRYAENLAAGQGLVFNPGDRVEGYSNLLYTLALAGLHAAGVPTLCAAQVLGAAAAVATLALLPPLARALGASPWSGVAAAAALGASATFTGWIFRGLETATFTALLVWGCTALSSDLAAGRQAGWQALAAFALLSVSRPEGVLYVAAAALTQIERRSPLLAPLRFVALSSLWVDQLLFRLWYYRQALPNTYYAKVWEGPERYRAGLDYVASYARACGTLGASALALGAVAALVAWRRAPARPVVLALVASLWFAVGSGGDGMPEGRFLHPALPLLFTLAATAIRGGAGLALSVILPALVIASPAAAATRSAASLLGAAAEGDAGARAWLATRRAILREPQESPQKKVGRWLAAHLPPGSLVAVNDCGVIPYVSGLPVLDTVGLMDWHIARLPGRKHQKVDLPYVLRRRPAAVVLALKNLGAGLPYDTRMASYGPFLSAYRLAYLVNYGPHCYHVFVRDARAPWPDPPAAIDLLSRLPEAVCAAATATGPAACDGLVRPGYRFVLLADAPRRIAELAAPLPAAGAEADGAAVARIDAAMRALAPVTFHGIDLSFPPGTTDIAVTIEVRGDLPKGATLRLGYGLAPWLWQRGETRAAVQIAVNVTGDAGFTRAGSVTSDPSRRAADRGFPPLALEIPAERRRLTVSFKATRAGPPESAGDPLEVLIAEPRLERHE